MGRTITATELRKDVYRLLDEALETGEAIEIRRKGRTLRIIPADPPRRDLWDKPDGRRTAIVGDLDDLVDVHWAYEPDGELFPQQGE